MITPSPVVQMGILLIGVSILCSIFILFLFINEFRRTGKYFTLAPVLLLIILLPLFAQYFGAFFINDSSFTVHIDEDPSCGSYIAHTNPALMQYLGEVYCYKARGVAGVFWEDDTSGQYDPVSRRLYLKYPESWWHELGHHIWHWLLTDEQREDYTRVFDSGSGSPSKYAEQNVEEDWAESFAYYYAPGEFIQYHNLNATTDVLDERREILIDFYVGRIVEAYYLQMNSDDLMYAFATYDYDPYS